MLKSSSQLFSDTYLYATWLCQNPQNRNKYLSLLKVFKIHFKCNGKKFISTIKISSKSSILKVLVQEYESYLKLFDGDTQIKPAGIFVF